MVHFEHRMDDKSCLIYAGEKFTLEWYYDINGKSVAMEFMLLNRSLIDIYHFLLMKRK